MASSAFESPLWQWPDHLPSSAKIPEDATSPNHHHLEQDESAKHGDNTEPNTQKHYVPRTCRICLETILPTFHPLSEHLPGILQPAPKVEYVSSDPELGRLIRPCKCKGSSKYVHEGCLQAWRHADPSYGKRNYWECPTCRFKYRLERVK